MNVAPDTILIAEDSEDDVFFVKRALKQAKITNPIQVVANGREAIGYLSGDGDFSDRSRHPLPCLLFLDLKMPYKNGFEVLAWIRAHASLAALPVVILTSSSEARDIDQARDLGAQAFLVKPADPDELKSLLERFATNSSKF
jgi:CheY-like chemotaxis protein